MLKECAKAYGINYKNKKEKGVWNVLNTQHTLRYNSLKSHREYVPST